MNSPRVSDSSASGSRRRGALCLLPPCLRPVCLALALFVTGTTACGENRSKLPFQAASATVAPDPASFGPYPVGVQTMTIDDPTRPRPSDGQPRRLITEVWYPAVEEARGGPGAYYDIMDLITQAQRELLEGARAPLLRTLAVRDAAPRLDWGRFPLIIFSHGQGGIRWQSTFFTVLLASHGYVVVSPDHEGNTLADGLRDNLSNPVEGFYDRPLDASLLIDRFAPSTGEGLLAGMVDKTRIGIAGHSFGALTALRVITMDTRIQAVVLHATPDATLSWIDKPNNYTVPIPMMVLGGGRDRTLPYVANTLSTFARLAPPRWLVNIKDGGHFTFSDLCGFNLSVLAGKIGIGQSVASALADGCTDPAPAASLTQPLINFFSVGFFNAQLHHSAPSLELLTQRFADQRWRGISEVTADPTGGVPSPSGPAQVP